MSVEVAVTAWYSKPTRSMWALMLKQSPFMRRQQALNSLLLGLAQHLQALCHPELQPTTAGSECRHRAVNFCLRPRTSQVQCSLFMGVKFQGWNYSLSIIKDAAVRRGKLGWFTLRECYINSGNSHKGHEKQTLIKTRNMKITFSICPALYYYSKCIQPIIFSVCFIIRKL